MPYAARLKAIADQFEKEATLAAETADYYEDEARGCRAVAARAGSNAALLRDAIGVIAKSDEHG